LECDEDCGCKPEMLKKRIHGAAPPLHEQYGLNGVPPVECSFRLGDKVRFVNDYGAEFELQVIGFADAVSKTGRFIHLDSGCWWFPVRPSSLTIIQAAPRDMTKDGYMIRAA